MSAREADAPRVPQPRAQGLVGGTRTQARVDQPGVPCRERLGRVPVVEIDALDAPADAREVEHVARGPRRVADAVVAPAPGAALAHADPDDAAGLGQPDLTPD